MIYGGKNEKDKYENDLWVFDVEKEIWHFIGKSNDIINFPFNSFLPTLSLVENKGIIISFGNTDIQYDSIYTIDIYILKQILFSEDSSKKSIKRNMVFLLFLSKSSIIFLAIFSKIGLSLLSSFGKCDSIISSVKSTSQSPLHLFLNSPERIKSPVP